MVVGFLGTAGPRLLGAEPWCRFEILWHAAMALAVMTALALNRIAPADLLLGFWLFGVLASLAFRVLVGRRDVPPPGFPVALLGVAGDSDAAGRRQRLDAGGDIDPVAEHVAVLDDDVADIQSHAEHDPVVRRGGRIVAVHGVLNGDCATDRIDRACELREEAVARRFENSSVMRRDLGLDERRAHMPQTRQSPNLVRLHAAAVAHHVGGQNCGKTAFHGATL